MLDETQRHLVDISLKNTDRLIRLINNILDISKMEAGHIHLDLELHRPLDFVEMAVDGIRGFAESRGIAIEAHVTTELPLVRVDVDRMVQVVTNLLSNAIKFSPERGRVSVGARRAGADLEIWVTDQGQGIAPEDVGRLFRKFQQLDGRTVRAVGGTGLGLAICRGIVEEHGGRIGVDSRPGEGATFTVRLPIPGTAGAAPSGERPEEADGGGAAGPGGGRRSRRARAAAGRAAARRVPGHRGGPRARGGGAGAPAAARRDHDGPHAAGPGRLRGDPPPARAARDARHPGGGAQRDRGRARRPRALGATVCLAKPFSSADLLKAIRSRLRPRDGVGA